MLRVMDHPCDGREVLNSWWHAEFLYEKPSVWFNVVITGICAEEGFCQHALEWHYQRSITSFLTGQV
jgi:hypothetical protein